jgi:hypothetical protein
MLENIMAKPKSIIYMPFLISLNNKVNYGIYISSVQSILRKL